MPEACELLYCGGSWRSECSLWESLRRVRQNRFNPELGAGSFPPIEYFPGLLSMG